MGDPNAITPLAQRLKAQYGITGRAFFVNGSSVYPFGGVAGADNPNMGTSELQPFATIDYAIGRCTASRGDAIFVAALHTETVTSAITLDVIGVQIIGLSAGAYIPTVTGNGTIDAMTVTAAACSIQNIAFAAPGTDAQTSDINIAAAHCLVKNTRHVGSTTAKNKVDIITITADGDNCIIDGVHIVNPTVEVVGGIVLEGAADAVEIKNCVILDVVGFTNGAIADEAAATNVFLHHNVIQNAKAATVVLSFANNSVGICSFNHVSGRHTTIASNVATGTSMDFFENRVTEEATLNGMIMPAADSE